MLTPPAYLLLGASNLWRIRSRLERALLRRDAGACVAAHRGPGRAYRVRAGLWFLRFGALLDVEPPPNLRAVLLMDIGSDLLYGVSPADLAAGLEAAADRFAAAGARVVAVPIFDSVERVGPVRYKILRTVFYPTSRLPLVDLRAGAADVNGRLRARAAAGGLALAEGLDGLVGPDGLHFVRWTEAAERLAAALVPR